MAIQYSIQKMVSDGTLSTIALGIQYLQRNDIYIRIAGEDTPQSGAPSGYTWSFLDNTTLKILPVVPNGAEVVVYRRTDVDAMYNIYSQNAQFDEATIDENNQQLLYIAQEYLEQGLPGTGVDTIEYVRDDGSFTYYRMRRTDGSYSEEFTVPSASNSTRVLTRESLRRSYAKAGYNLVNGSFQAGFTMGNHNDVALDESTGIAYSGAPGAYPAGTSTSGFVDRSASLGMSAGDVRRFGALGGGHDDTAAYLAAAAKINSGEINEIVLLDGSVISSDVVFNKPHKIIGNNANILQNGGSLKAVNPIVSTHQLISNALQNSVEVADASGIEVGDLISITCDTLFPYDNRGTLTYGELWVVGRKSGNILFIGGSQFTSQFRFGSEYTVAANAKIEVRKSATLDWGKFQQTNISNTASGWLVEGFINPRIRASQHKCLQTGASVKECFNPDVSGVFADNYDGSTPIGYGVQFNACRLGGLHHSAVLNNRRGCDVSGKFPSIGCVISFNTSDGNGGDTGSAFGTHGPAADISFFGNNLGRDQYGFIIRGLNCSIVGNTCREAQISFVHYTDGAAINVSGNSVGKCQRLIGIYRGVIEKKTNNDVEAMHLDVIRDNTARGVLRPAIGFDTTSSNKNLYGFVVRDNNIYTAPGTSSRYMIGGIDDTDNVSDFVFGAGCVNEGNVAKGRNNFLGWFHSDFKVDPNPDIGLSMHNIDPSSLGGLTITKSTGSGNVSGSVLGGDLSLWRGRVVGMVAVTFTVTDGPINGVVLNAAWIKEQFPSGSIGRQNPLSVKAGSGSGMLFAQVRGDGVIFIGNSANSITAPWPIGEYTVFVYFDTRDQHYMTRRYQV